ncbi:enoyl-CoA hydratase/isomerase family protein [Novosphingobium taihuense]|uniref:Enoyl-CoA hydratase n=1 Tax=Novosphingobium taihuense TaxID=260085 RepID=A0A7W7AC55_9SPHN|nr:enoyl-CoA hydratase-related protein [Novosphingobium taihuense]MBB4614212.1 enoyl-CoA hydratase [Novosphingobium taihuense]TWH87060.1 Enoyl-CoA hydratase [Novosphingobium taihuense]
MTDTILLDSPEEGVCRITLNRPEVLNAFTWPMYEALLDALADIRRDPATRVVILTATGRGFCAGHDLKNAGPSPYHPDGVGKAYGNRHSLIGLGQIPVAMRNLPQPIVCAVNGTVAGVGYTLALASDMTIAVRSAKFINTIHNAATGAELGLSYMMSRAVGSQRAAELLLTSRPVMADEAERIGLILRAVDDDKLIDEALVLARGVMANVPMGIWLTKQSLWLNQSAGSLEAAIELENRAVAIAQATEDAKEKRAAFWEKRQPKFKME